MAEMLENIEDGLGADGVGHGKLKPPADETVRDEDPGG